MANVFFRQNKMDIANSLYAEVGKTNGHPLYISQFFSVLFPMFFLLLTAFNMMVIISSASIAF